MCPHFDGENRRIRAILDLCQIRGSWATLSSSHLASLQVTERIRGSQFCSGDGYHPNMFGFACMAPIVQEAMQDCPCSITITPRHAIGSGTQQLLPWNSSKEWGATVVVSDSCLCPVQAAGIVSTLFCCSSRAGSQHRAGFVGGPGRAPGGGDASPGLPGLGILLWRREKLRRPPLCHSCKKRDGCFSTRCRSSISCNRKRRHDARTEGASGTKASCAGATRSSSSVQAVGPALSRNQAQDPASRSVRGNDLYGWRDPAPYMMQLKRDSV